MKSKYLLLVFLFIMSCATDNNNNRNLTDSEMLKLCSSDKECISVASGCCGCNSGGSNTAINSKNLSEWTAHQKQNCKLIACPMMISNNASCKAKPICLNGLCTLK